MTARRRAKLTKAEAGRLGGLKGGRTRARTLSPERLCAIATMGGHAKADEQRRAKIIQTTRELEQQLAELRTRVPAQAD